VAEHGGTFVSAGVGYEYRLPVLGDAVGVGGMAELMLMSGGAHPMLMGSASLHPAGGLLLQTSVGVTHRHEQGGTATSSSGARMSTAGVVRLTAGYDFHAGGVMLTPNVNADLGARSTRAFRRGCASGRCSKRRRRWAATRRSRPRSQTAGRIRILNSKAGPWPVVYSARRERSRIPADSTRAAHLTFPGTFGSSPTILFSFTRNAGASASPHFGQPPRL
jgi:hypothetical protein